jgi:transcriptional regulator with XRE-family HTH domain
MTRRGNRGPTPADVRFGQKLRTRRLMLGLTQTELGAAINVTFQQIQKYERGRNRVRASMLEKLAGTMGVPITYFFEQSDGGDGSTATLNAFLATPAGLALFTAFQRLDSEGERRAVINLLQEMTKKH